MILISPWSRQLPDGKSSPKNYPWFPEVVKQLVRDHELVQIGVEGELDIGCTYRKNNLPLRNIEQLIQQCDTWVSVDNFFHHLAWTVGKSGVVIFGKSDPAIFGHPENINLLLDRKYLRKNQFNWWVQESWDPTVFVSPEVVIAAVKDQVKQQTGMVV